jgi:putative transposase
MTNPLLTPSGNYFPGVPAPRGLHAVRPRHRPPLNDATLKDLSLYQLRQAIRVNTVTFPSPVPTFERHDRPDLQWRIAQLYFVSGWSSDGIAKRFGILRQRACQILNTWKRRAVEMGYIQCIPPAETIEWPDRAIQAVISTAAARPPTTARSITVTCDNVFEDQRPLVNPRPRRKADLLQIIEVLKQLAAGKAASELARGAGVTTGTVYDWKQKYSVLASDAQEAHKLRDENAQLKKMVAKLSATKDTLIYPIRKSYRLHV